MFSGQEKILDEMGSITLAKDALKLYNNVDPGTSSYFLILNNFYDWWVSVGFIFRKVEKIVYCCILKIFVRIYIFMG